MINELTAQLIRDEGRCRSAYYDHLGNLTIGVGRMIDARKGGKLRDDEIDYLLRNDINDRVDAVTRALPWFQDLDDARKGVILNMAFQMGVAGLLGFKTTLEHVKEGRYATAAKTMLASKWATQTPERAHRLSEQMLCGVWR